MSGIQALVRLLIEQRRLDLAPRPEHRGLRHRLSRLAAGRAGPGDRAGARAPRAPGGRVLARGQRGARRHRRQRHPARRAAAGRTHDGVVGVWYGKAPGLDRAADAIRHGNISGTAHLGGAVALDRRRPDVQVLDPSQLLRADGREPDDAAVLALPASADIVGVGLHAVALSRAAGLWTAVKIVSDVADASAAVPSTRWPRASRSRRSAAAAPHRCSSGPAPWPPSTI